MWKTSDLRKFAIWFLTFFEEDNGKASEKRLIVAFITIVLIKIIFYCTTAIDAGKMSVIDSCYIMGTIFGFICVLLGLNYIPTRGDKAP